jgi:hypothetical protein
VILKGSNLVIGQRISERMNADAKETIRNGKNKITSNQPSEFETPETSEEEKEINPESSKFFSTPSHT